MADEQTTPAQRALAEVSKRNGKCLTVSSTCDCQAYALMGRVDGFATCVCRHTQWAHEVSVGSTS